MAATQNISAKQFQACHASLLKVLDEADTQISQLQPPYRQSVVYNLRRGLYKIEKTTKSFSLKLLPMLAYELEAFAVDLTKAEESTVDAARFGPLSQSGLTLIREALEALARGEPEASVEKAAAIGELVNNLRQQCAVASSELDLTPSAVVVVGGDDELDNFEKSLQAMQQELQGVLSNKPSSSAE